MTGKSRNEGRNTSGPARESGFGVVAMEGVVQLAVPTTGSGEERARHYKEAFMHFCRVNAASGAVRLEALLHHRAAE